MSLSSNVVRRGAVYYARMRVPKDLANAIGRRELVQSLKTRDPVEALGLARLLIAKWQVDFDSRRNTRNLSSETARSLARFHYREILRIDNAGRALDQQSNHNRLPERLEKLSEWEKDVRRHLATASPAYVMEEADDLLRRAGFDADAFRLAQSDPTTGAFKTTSEYLIFCQMMTRAHAEGIRRVRERDEGIFDGRPTDVLFVDIGEGHAEFISNPTNGAAPEIASDPGYLSTYVLQMHTERSIAAATKLEHIRAVQLFEEFLGARKPVTKVTKADVLGFKRALIRCPKNLKARFPGMTMADATIANESRPVPMPTLDFRTINEKWLSHIKAVFTWCESNSIIERSPAAGVRVDTGKGTRARPRFPFTVEQLQVVFKLMPFDGMSPRDAKFWVPLVALFSGARSDELGQLRCGDVRIVNGVNCLAITTGSEDGGALHLKTDSSERLVPIHPELIRLGFLDYVAQGVRTGSARVFAGWEADSLGRYSSSLPRWWNRTHLVQAGIKSKKLVFHSLRHSFKDGCRNGGVSEEVHDAFTGHAGESVGRGYGTGHSIEALNQQVMKVTFAPLDLSHLYPKNADARINAEPAEQAL
jgi:integrase